MDESKATCSEVRRVFVIGIDGGTWRVLRPLVEAGQMPTLASLLERSAWGDLISTIPPHTAPAWATYITGKNPGKHGIYQFGPIDRSLYEGGWRRIVNSSTLAGPAIWDLIGATGRKVGIINVPLTYPPRPVNGFLVTGMLTPRDSRNFTYPPSLASQLKDYRIDITSGKQGYGYLGEIDTDDETTLENLIRDLTDMMIQRTDAAVRLIMDFSPDYFMIFFTETDRVQHLFWPSLNEDISDDNEPLRKRFREPVKDFFRHLDENLAKLLHAAGDDVIKILLSDHGFGPATKKDVNFNAWLVDQGVLKLQQGTGKLLNARYWLRKAGLNRETLYSLMGAFLPRHAVRKLRKACDQFVGRPIDWDASRAVFIPVFEFVGGIQILPPGKTGPRDENLRSESYEVLRERLIRGLRELRDPESHQQIVTEIYRREDIYHGPELHKAPDIVFLMSTDYRGDKGLLGKSLVSKSPSEIKLWLGTHRRKGFLIINGAPILPGELSNPPEIKDLAPTILYLLGIAIPQDMDGRVIQEAIHPSYLAHHEIKFAQPLSMPGQALEGTVSGYSQEEMRKVKQQLESLGYLS